VRDYRRVTRLAADGGKDASGLIHAVNIVGSGLIADQNDGAGFRHLDGIVGRECGALYGGAG
jgi:hypothetical protein